MRDSFEELLLPWIDSMVGDLRRVRVSEAEFWSLLIGLSNGGLMPDGQ